MDSILRRIFLFSFYSRIFCYGPNVVLNTKTGKVIGEVVENSGFSGEVYESIPYALSPEGALRFELPRKRSKWTGLLDVRNKTACYQFYAESSVDPSDDCLRIKLVIPLDASKKRYSQKLPMLFWIHGGSYQIGGKYYYENSGVLRNIASKRIVFAAIDYRLGFDGFLSAKDDEFPGNLGLADILLGLNFLRENHENIGFDINNIVVSGESAGSALAGLVAVSPRFKGLVHAAIMFSGTPTGSWAVRNKYTLTNTREVFENCDCVMKTSREIKECMKKAQTSCYHDDITPMLFKTNLHKNHSITYENIRMGMTIFTPIIDDFRGDEAFLPDQPELVVKANAHLPVLISNTAHERMSLMRKIARELSAFGKEAWVNAIVPIRYNGSSTIRLLLAERYLQSELKSPSERGIQYHKMAEEEITSEAHHEALFYADRNITVYTLLNNVYDEELGGADGKYCTDHGVDLGIVFDSKEIVGVAGNFTKNELDWGRSFSGKLSQIIADFVYTKKLSNHPQFTRSHRTFIHISNRSIEHRTYDHEAYYFWKQLLPTIARFNLNLPKDQKN